METSCHGREPDPAGRVMVLVMVVFPSVLLWWIGKLGITTITLGRFDVCYGVFFPSVLICIQATKHHGSNETLGGRFLGQNLIRTWLSMEGLLEKWMHPKSLSFCETPWLQWLRFRAFFGILDPCNVAQQSMGVPKVRQFRLRRWARKSSAFG